MRFLGGPNLSRSLRTVGFHECKSIRSVILDMGSQSPHPLFAKGAKSKDGAPGSSDLVSVVPSGTRFPFVGLTQDLRPGLTYVAAPRLRSARVSAASGTFHVRRERRDSTSVNLLGFRFSTWEVQVPTLFSQRARKERMGHPDGG